MVSSQGRKVVMDLEQLLRRRCCFRGNLEVLGDKSLGDEDVKVTWSAF